MHKQRYFIVGLWFALILTIYLWNDERKTVENLNFQQRVEFHQGLHELNMVYSRLAEVFRIYDEDFSKQEKDLYLIAIESELRNIENLQSRFSVITARIDPMKHNSLSLQLESHFRKIGFNIKSMLTEEEGNSTKLNQVAQILEQSAERLSDILIEDTTMVMMPENQLNIEEILKEVESGF